MTPANVTATLILWKAEILSAAVCNQKISIFLVEQGSSCTLMSYRKRILCT